MHYKDIDKALLSYLLLCNCFVLITDSDDERNNYLRDGQLPHRGRGRGRGRPYRRFNRGGRRRERNSEADMNGDHQLEDGGEHEERGDRGSRGG